MQTDSLHLTPIQRVMRRRLRRERAQVATEEDVIFRYAQDLFAPGLTTIVGSGASCAFGLPTMADIAKELLARVPEDLTDPSGAEAEVWQRVELALLAGETLEAALGPGPVAPGPRRSHYQARRETRLDFRVCGDRALASGR